VHLGSDTGGTFTDLVDEAGRTAKVLSTPADPGAAVRAGVGALGGGSVPATLAHGTTVATNALLERRLARTALVTTDGIADVIEIARQDRPSLYDLRVDRPPALVARDDRIEVRERLAADGSVLVPLDCDGLADRLPAGVDAVAVCLLHSDLNPAHEAAVVAALRAARPDIDVSASTEISPEMREYERTVTTVANAALRPVCRTYLSGLRGLAAEVLVLTSAGGLISLSDAAGAPARLLLSGPAGGVRAAAAIGVANGCPDLLTFDMGGTSTDVCLVLGGRPAPASERTVAGYPIRLPSLDVHTVGAGGGSIASLDAGGALVVGPRSAGAVPGPACYGRGGIEPTVTDANLATGRIPAEGTFPELGPLDLGAARAALARADVTADGVLAVVNANMVRALRHVSVERGVDPRGLALVAFGGAGPLHACDLADELGIATVIVPPRAGVFSAVGVLGSPRWADAVQSWPTPRDHGGLGDFEQMVASVALDRLGVGGTVEVEVSFDCRYEGQSHELRVPSVDAFEAEHERRNGYRRPGHPIEVLAVRAVAWQDSPVDIASLPAPDRAAVVGPAVLAEPDCTIWVPDGWRGQPGEAGALVLRRRA
jgi:N-methylhydantoinase A/oxoprolinase/acetone carboxylase beta subunit